MAKLTLGQLLCGSISTCWLPAFPLNVTHTQPNRSALGYTWKRPELFVWIPTCRGCNRWHLPLNPFEIESILPLPTVLTWLAFRQQPKTQVMACFWLLGFHMSGSHPESGDQVFDEANVFYEGFIMVFLSLICHVTLEYLVGQKKKRHPRSEPGPKCKPSQRQRFLQVDWVLYKCGCTAGQLPP